MFLLGLIWACSPKTTPPEDTGSDGETDFLDGEVDSDQDGFPASEDCDDSNAEVNPDGTDIPNDGIDQDCDGQDLQSPVISTDPMVTDFAEVAIGCVKKAELVVSNGGLDTLELTSADFQTANGPFGLYEPANGGMLNFPISIPIDGSQAIGIQFEPNLEGAYSDALTLTSNDVTTPDYSISISGTGIADGFGEDEHRQGHATPTADIIFAVDVSPSMQQMNYPEALYNSITGLTNQLVDNNVDYRLSAVAQASGCVAGPTLYIDNSFSSADIQSAFEGMISVQNTYSASSEKNLQTLKYALESDQQGQCNEGLVRENTKLNLIGVSEEDDESPLPYTEYLNAYNNHVYGQNDLRVHAIGSDPTLCQVPNYYAGLYDASIATGGFFFSICTDPIDWTYELETLADNITAHAEDSLYLDTIALTHPAVEASIEVFVDGTPLTSGWTFNDSENSITFDSSAIPEVNQIIRVNYIILAECEE